jgi:hypothetical protein
MEAPNWKCKQGTNMDKGIQNYDSIFSADVIRTTLPDFRSRQRLPKCLLEEGGTEETCSISTFL